MYRSKSYQVVILVVFAILVSHLALLSSAQAADESVAAEIRLVDHQLSIASDFVMQATVTGVGLVDRLTKSLSKMSEVKIFTGKPASLEKPIQLHSVWSIGPCFGPHALGVQLKIAF